MQELHDKCFVRTSASADATGYPKLAAAKGALESLANGHAKDPQRARECSRWTVEVRDFDQGQFDAVDPG
jgi:hypothetical protein